MPQDTTLATLEPTALANLLSLGMRHFAEASLAFSWVLLTLGPRHSCPRFLIQPLSGTLSLSNLGFSTLATFLEVHVKPDLAGCTTSFKPL
eukprot:7709833-Lingulodinium_polyedra.AAC.1